MRNKERDKEYQKLYRLNNKEKYLAYQKKYREENKDKQFKSDYYHANKFN